MEKNKINKKIQGKKNKAAGQRFEVKVRKDLESKGWFVFKNTNNVEFEIYTKEGKMDKRKKVPLIEMIPKVSSYGVLGETFQEKKSTDKEYLFSVGRKGKIVSAKYKFRGKGIPMMLGAGFPDFACSKYKKSISAAFSLTAPLCEIYPREACHEFIGVEVKSNGYLDPKEREKCKWLLDNNIFSKILIASKGTKRGQIVYKEFASLV